MNQQTRHIVKSLLRTTFLLFVFSDDKNGPNPESNAEYTFASSTVFLLSTGSLCGIDATGNDASDRSDAVPALGGWHAGSSRLFTLVSSKQSTSLGRVSPTFSHAPRFASLHPSPHASSHPSQQHSHRHALGTPPSDPALPDALGFADLPDSAGPAGSENSASPSSDSSDGDSSESETAGSERTESSSAGIDASDVSSPHCLESKPDHNLTESGAPTPPTTRTTPTPTPAGETPAKRSTGAWRGRWIPAGKEDREKNA